MFVGEAPGREEDTRACRSSAAPANCSTACWRRSGSTAAQVYIANIVPWRPPGNRTPTPVRRRRSACRSSSARSSSANPDMLVCSASRRPDAARHPGRHHQERAAAGSPYNTGTRDIRAMPTLHPAYLLRTPLAKRLAWRDMLAIKKALATEN